MKKLLLTMLLAAGFTALIPNISHADCGREYALLGYDHCGRPVYGYVERHESYGRDYDRGYGGDYDEYRGRHYRSRYNDYDHCQPHCFLPGFSFFFGR